MSIGKIFYADVERPIRREIVFSGPSGADFVKITPKQELTVTVKTIGADVYYVAQVRGGA